MSPRSHLPASSIWRACAATFLLLVCAQQSAKAASPSTILVTAPAANASLVVLETTTVAWTCADGSGPVALALMLRDANAPLGHVLATYTDGTPVFQVSVGWGFVLF